MKCNYIEHQLCEYMIVHKLYTHRDIKLEKTCQIMGVTPTYLTEYLSEKLNTSFTEMVHSYRIEEAKEMWAKSGMAFISKVARAVGYGNSLVFLLHFARLERCLPYVWKRRNLISI